MSTDDNKLLVSHIFAALADGDSRPLVESFADDVRWTVRGTNSWSGTYEGKDAVLRELFAPLRAALVAPIRTVPLRIFADGDHVVVEARGDNHTRSGKGYENRYCFVIHVEATRLREIVEYGDSELVAAVLGERRPRGMGRSA